MTRGWTWWHTWLSLSLLACALVASAAEPTAQPLPRLETGMHTAVIKRIATDASGRWAVTASDDKTARVWDLADPGKPAQVLRPPQDAGDEGKLFAVAMSPDGETVAVGGWTGYDWERSVSIYLFERRSGKLLRRLGGLPNVINHLAFSPDGRWLAASLGGMNGVRLFDSRSGRETGRDADYGGDSYSVAFSADGRRLLATCFDGELRLYVLEGGVPGPAQRVRPGGGEQPFSARFSPDGRHVAVGFSDRTVVQVLDARTLREVARPDTVGVGNGSLSNVAWTVDGRLLLAAGRWDVDGKSPARRWRVADWSRERDLPLADNTVMDLVPLPDGALLFAAYDPAWGVLDAAGTIRLRRDPAIADLRTLDGLRLSPDARQLRFVDLRSGAVRSFDLAGRSLGSDIATLRPARTTGLKIERWEDDRSPTLDGKPIELEPNEESRSLAIAPDGQRFVLGADWRLRQFDRTGKPTWPKPQPVPGVAWAVNYSGDGRFVVAAYGDGTIRWHRAGDGSEVLALFAHADGKRWIAWVPQGFYAASGPDAEELFGYHLNRGREREGEFVSARQLREHFHQPGLISRRLDADGDRLLDAAVAQLGDVRQLLAEGTKAATPLVEIVDLKVDGDEVTFSVRVTDRGGGVGDLSFYVDGQPQTGRQSGVAGDATSPRTFTPPPGARVIAVAARNRLGIEGPRDARTVQIAGTRQRGTLHVLAVGVDLPPLRYSADDARVLAKELADRASAVFQQVRPPKVLVNEQATLAGIERAFAEIRRDLGPQDTLVIFLAGHGEAPLGRGYTFLPWGYQPGAGGAAGTGLGERQLREMLAAAPLQTLLLLDTCDAGGAIEMLEASYERLRGSKQVVIGASRRGEFAQEGFDNHGVFTAALLRVMRAKPEHEDERELRVPQLRASVDSEVRRIMRTMGSGSGQKVTGFIGSADFPLLRR